MREKIIQLSKGEFNYVMPDIILSEDNIVLHIEEGNNYQGSFSISNSEGIEMKGVISSGDIFLTFNENCFIGVNNKIEYEVHGKELLAGDTLDTRIEIVCDCGEIMIPVNIIVVDPYCNTSLGNLKDIFHFTSLAKENWQEAFLLFQSSEFQRVFLRYDIKNQIRYENLIKSKDVNWALEEFLVGAHKKLPVNLKISQRHYEYTVDNDVPFMDRIMVEKDNWGYLNVEVHSDAAFIQLEKSYIVAEHFIGSSCFIEFVVDPSHLRVGNNYGEISIITYKEIIKIMVTCRYRKAVKAGEESCNRYQRQIQEFAQSYMEFRGGEIKLAQYIQKVEPILIDLSQEENQILYTMILVHVYWNSNREEQARELLDDLKRWQDKWLEDSELLLYCALRYLEAYISGEEESVEAAIEDITIQYENGYRDWRILWFLFYLDKKYEENPLLKLGLIREQVLLGVRSPVFYHEALNIYQREPSLLHELGRFEIQIINYGVKYHCVQIELASQYVFLVSREKEYHSIIYRNLVKLYHIYETKEILTGICIMLIKGQKFGQKYHHWYTLGIQEQLKITQLPESYMYSIEEDKNMILPSSIYQYFIYNSSLSDNRKAYLYASIIRQKENNPSLYRTYLKQIENFARKQIAFRRIHSNLAVIYHDIFTKELITPEIGRDLTSILFTYEIRCQNPNIKGVSVTHKELVQDKYVPFIEGKAFIHLFTENFELTLVDKKENRHIATSEYTLDKLLDSNWYIDICYAYCPNDPMILLNLSEKLDTYHRFNRDAASIGEKVITISGIRETYYKSQFMSLLEYYDENMEGDKLEVFLNTMELSLFRGKDRNKLIEYTLRRGMYERAYYFIRRYGYHGKNMRKIAALCSKLLSGELGVCNLSVLEEDSQEREFFVHLCYKAFLSGKYNTMILEFLLRYYYSSTKNMYQLWRISKENHIDTKEFEERLLGQILFAESYLEHAFSVFASYYEHGNNGRLIRGFLSYYSYRYLVHGRIIDPNIFYIIQKELVVEEIEVCLLALLKHYSTKKELSEDEIKFIEHYIEGFMKEGMILPFFKDFKDKIRLPRYILERTYIEYKANPSHKVTICYRKNDDDEEYIEERMENRYLGIHVKDFALFYNDELQYYIIEEVEGTQMITESVPLKSDYVMEEVMSNFNSINLMLMARELKDDKTLEEAVKGYIENKVLIKEMFYIK